MSGFGTSTWLCAAVATIAIGCAASHDHGNSPPGSDQDGVGAGGDHDGTTSPPPPPMACGTAASGSIELQLAISGGAHVAMDVAGNIIYTADAGIVKITPTGAQVFAFAFGDFVAVDARGNIYIAGSFTSPIDLGAGTMTPEGNIDVFVAKLSPEGKLLFVKQLGLCGDGIESIAVDRAGGRIAISGSAMGTVVLDASGDITLQLALAGQLAFDSHGDLFVAGSFTGSIDLGGGDVLTAASSTDVDAFVVKLDASGNVLSSYQLGDAALPLTAGAAGTVTAPQQQSVLAISINASDEVAFAGVYDAEMSLFGQVITTPRSFDSGELSGMFTVRLDASGAVALAIPGEITGDHQIVGVAIDSTGNIALSSNLPGDAFAPFAFPQLTKYDLGGRALFGLGNDTGALGFGLAVAVDACGNIAWTDTEHSSVMVPQQPTLRLVAP